MTVFVQMTARLFCFRKAGSGHDPQWRQLKLAARGSKHVNVITLGKLPIVNSRHLSATIGSPATVQNENSALRRRTLYFTLRLFWAPATSHINSLPRISNVRNRLRKAGSKQSLLLTSGLLSPVPSQARWRPVLPFFFLFSGPWARRNEKNFGRYSSHCRYFDLLILKLANAALGFLVPNWSTGYFWGANR